MTLFVPVNKVGECTVGGPLLRPNPTGRGAPEDGFVMLLCIGSGLVFSLSFSVLLARRSWRLTVAQ